MITSLSGADPGGIKVAGDAVPRVDLGGRGNLGANLHDVGAAGPEPAPRRRVEGTWHFPFDLQLGAALAGVDGQCRVKETFGVRMPGSLEDLFNVPCLHDP